MIILSTFSCWISQHNFQILTIRDQIPTGAPALQSLPRLKPSIVESCFCKGCLYKAPTKMPLDLIDLVSTAVLRTTEISSEYGMLWNSILRPISSWQRSVHTSCCSRNPCSRSGVRTMASHQQTYSGLFSIINAQTYERWYTDTLENNGFRSHWTIDACGIPHSWIPVAFWIKPYKTRPATKRDSLVPWNSRLLATRDPPLSQIQHHGSPWLTSNCHDSKILELPELQSHSFCIKTMKNMWY